MERNEADTISSKVEHLEAELVAMRTKLDQEVEQRHAQGRNMDLTMERNEADTISSKVELVAMRTKLDQEVEQRHAQGRNMDAQLLEAKKQLESLNVRERQLQQKTRELLRTSEQQVVVLRAQLASSSSSSSSLEAGTTATAASGPATRGAGLRAPPKAGPKRVREEEEEEPETSHSPPSSKKLRLRQTVTLLEEGDGGMEGEDEMDRPDSVDNSQEIPEVGFPVLGTEESEDVGVSQSVPSDQVIPQAAPQGRDVIVIDTDSESHESKESEEEEEEEEEEKEEEEEDDEYKEEDDEDTGDGGMGGEGSNDGSGGAEEEEEEEEGAMSSEDSQPVKEEENLGAASSDCSSRPSSHSGEGSSSAVEPLPPREMLYPQPSSTTSSPAPPTSSLTPRPPRLYIQPPTPELGPPHAQRQSSQLRRPSVGRGPQLTPGIGSMQHFFDDDDRMVPSTPTLVVPHRTDGFAEAIHSPQVAALSTRFRFGPPEDLLPQSSGHSDLGQLASHGDSSSAPRRPLVGHAQSSSLASRGPAFRGRGDGRTTLIRRGVTFSRAGRGGVPQ
ncbi:unnamed protein product [Boreogadus saida]